ncbi:hypothetical protein ACFL0L_02050 [Patescibacteria group bacterium]
MKKLIITSLALFLLGFIALQIPFSVLIGGQDQHFSLFDFIAPALGGFIGSITGVFSVIGVKALHALFHNDTFDTLTIIRLFPLAFGALYFGLKRHKHFMALVPFAAIILFTIHPEGRSAWFYSLFWLIPIVSLFVKKSLFFNSLGSTFTAHAVGSVAFLYAFNLPSEVWIALIPIVFIERMLFTSGIAIFYLTFNTALSYISKLKYVPMLSRFVDSRYVLSKKFLSKFV